MAFLAGVVVLVLFLVGVVSRYPAIEPQRVTARESGISRGDLQLARSYAEMYRVPRAMLLDETETVSGIESADWAWDAGGGNVGVWRRECGSARDGLVTAGVSSGFLGGAVAAEALCVFDAARVVKTGTPVAQRCGRVGLAVDAGGGARFAGRAGGGAPVTVGTEVVSDHAGGSHGFREWDWRSVEAANRGALQSSVAGVYGRGLMLAQGGVQNAGGTPRRLADRREPWQVDGYALSAWTEDGATVAAARRAEIFLTGPNCWLEAEDTVVSGEFAGAKGILAATVDGDMAAVFGTGGKLEMVDPVLQTHRAGRVAGAPPSVGMPAGPFVATLAPAGLGIRDMNWRPALPAAGGGGMAYRLPAGGLPAANGGTAGWRENYCRQILGLAAGSVEHNLCSWRNF